MDLGLSLWHKQPTRGFFSLKVTFPQQPSVSRAPLLGGVVSVAPSLFMPEFLLAWSCRSSLQITTGPVRWHLPKLVISRSLHFRVLFIWQLSTNYCLQLVHWPDTEFLHCYLLQKETSMRASLICAYKQIWKLIWQSNHLIWVFLPLEPVISLVMTNFWQVYRTRLEMEQTL